MSIRFEVENECLSIYDNNRYLVANHEYAKQSEFMWDADNDLEYFFAEGLNSIESCSFPEKLIISQTYPVDNTNYKVTIYLDKSKIIYSIDFIYKEWRNPFTIRAFVNKFEDTLIGLDFSFESEKELDDEACIFFLEKNIKKSENILTKVTNDLDEIKNIILLTEQYLFKENSDNLIIKIFEFPEDYQYICSQYLLWFGELLSDIGIKADVSSESKKGKVILTIDSKNDYELKASIEKTLYMYLLLPYSEYIPLETSDTNIEQQISYQLLQSQVEDFKTRIELKNAIIEYKSLSNEKLKNELEKEKEKGKLLLLESMKASKIQILGGALSIGEYKIGPLKINPKKILEILKPKQ